MALKGKVETEVEIKATADEFYNFLKSTPHQLPSISGDKIQGVEHEQGDWDSHGHGSIKVWKLVLEGEVETVKEKVEFDDESKTMTCSGLEGEQIFKMYKMFKAIYQALPKDEGCFVRLAIEYEKHNKNIPAPTKYIDLMTKVVKDMGNHLKA